MHILEEEYDSQNCILLRYYARRWFLCVPFIFRMRIV